MEIQPIKVSKPFAARQFKIPLVEGVNERAAMNDFGEFCRLLATWGFEPLLTTRSFSHSALSQKHSLREEDYQLWAHPAGVLANISSYSSPGYTDSAGNQRPPRHTLNMLKLEAKVDSGNGSELQHRASVEIRGSGGTTPQFDGRQVRSVYEIIHSNSTGSIHRFLRTAQKYGRLLPFERWSEVQERSLLSLGEELVDPVVEWTKGEPFESQDYAAKEEAAFQKLPPHLADVFRKEVIATRLAKEASARNEKRPGLSWDPIEFGISEFSEAMHLAGRRFPKPKDRDLLSHWSRVALGEFGDTLDPIKMRAFEKGPAGLSLATALLYTKRSAPLAEGLLQQLLDEAPEDVLLGWATEPDAAGYTLGLRAVARSFTDRMLTNHAPPGVDVLGILYRRLGLDGLVMSTPTRSLLGLLMQEPHGRSVDHGKVMEMKNGEMATAIHRLNEWGVEWKDHLRWRSYPNLYMDKELPTFYQINGPVDPTFLKARIGPNWTGHLDAMHASLVAVQMEKQTVPIPSVRAPMRSRL